MSREFAETGNAEPAENEAFVQILRILLVEDNELNMEIAQYLLEDAGMNAHLSKPLDG